MKRLAALGILVFLASLQTGCATIINGTTQRIGISSTPTGAHVLVDGEPQGKTPTFAELKRKHTHMVRVRKDGYMPYETTLTRRVSGWVWGNLAFGGIPGIIIDPISGGMFRLEPEQVHANLTARKEPSESGGR